MERRPRPPIRPLHSPPLHCSISVHCQKWRNDTILMSGSDPNQNDVAQKMPSSGSACTPYWRQSIGTSYQDSRHGDPAPTSSGSQHSPQTRNVPGNVDGCTHRKSSLEAEFEETSSSRNKRILGGRRNEESTKCEGDGGSTNRDVDASRDKDLRLLRYAFRCLVCVYFFSPNLMPFSRLCADSSMKHTYGDRNTTTAKQNTHVWRMK